MKNNPRSVSDFLATMPRNESWESAQFRVAVAWDAVRELELYPTMSHFHHVEVENYFRAAQQHRDSLER
jgi:hypothetical protein